MTYRQVELDDPVQMTLADHLADHMLFFVELVDAGSLASVGRRRDCTRQAVSARLEQLESQIGLLLLHRNSRRMSLTAAGKEFYARSKRVVAEIRGTEDELARLRKAPAGELRVTAPMSFGRLYLAPLIADFSKAFPDLLVEVDLDDKLVDIVKDGYDVAVRIGLLSGNSLVGKRLADIHRVVCASPEYFKRRGIPQVPEDLRQHDCILYSNATNPSKWKFKAGLTVEVHGKLRVNNGEVRQAAALAGLGVVNMPTFIVGPDVRAGRLQAVLTDYMACDQAIYAVYPEARPRLVRPNVKAFVTLLKNRLAERVWDDGLGFLAK